MKDSDGRAKKIRTKKASSSTATSSTDNQDRSFDRGSIEPCAVDSAHTIDAILRPQLPLRSPEIEDEEDEDSGEDDPTTREAVKESSRSKVVAKKRAAGPSADKQSKWSMAL